MIHLVTASILSLLVTGASFGQNRVPRFKDYPVSERYRGQNASLVLKRDDRMFRTRLREAAKAKPNFAGHYILTAWGCGALLNADITLEKVTAMANALTHAGGVVFRTSDSRNFYLVVSSSDGANWVLPKGHIEPGESPEEAALRELKEEAGVVGEIVERLSAQHFKKADKEVDVQYFLIHELGSTEAVENRTVRWEGELAALQLLTFEEARAALLEGAAILRRSDAKQ